MNKLECNFAEDRCYNIVKSCSWVSKKISDGRKVVFLSFLKQNILLQKDTLLHLIEQRFSMKLIFVRKVKLTFAQRFIVCRNEEF